MVDVLLQRNTQMYTRDSKCGDGLAQKYYLHETTKLKYNYLNSLQLRKKDCHFADDIFDRVFLTENVCIFYWYST